VRFAFALPPVKDAGNAFFDGEWEELYGPASDDFHPTDGDI
jgi:hypothetical protein